MMDLELNELTPGMILDRPVYNRQGVRLLDRGVRVTEKHIRIFRSWGITQVAVRGDASAGGEADAGNRTERLATAEDKLQEKFADVLDNPVMVEIMRAARRLLNDHPSAPDVENERS